MRVVTKMLKATFGVFLGCFLVWSNSALAQTRNVRLCDTYAGTPLDFELDMGLKGVALADIDFFNAQKACEAARWDAPQNPRMYLQLGRAYFAHRYYENAYNHFQSATRLGSVIAHYYLAVMFVEGLGVRKNPAEAVRMLQHVDRWPDAIALLGTLYLKGEGVERDEQKGRVLLQDASAKGSSYARDELAKHIAAVNARSDIRTMKCTHSLKELNRKGLCRHFNAEQIYCEAMKTADEWDIIAVTVASECLRKCFTGEHNAFCETLVIDGSRLRKADAHDIINNQRAFFASGADIRLNGKPGTCEFNAYGRAPKLNADRFDMHYSIVAKCYLH